MAYNQAQLITDVRMRLGQVSVTALPDTVILYWGDNTDQDTRYTDKYAWIFYKTTLASINYLKLNAVASGAATAASITEKVGDVSKTVKNSTSTDGSNILDIWDKLYKQFEADPESFGIVSEGRTTGSILVGGIYADKVEGIRQSTSLNSVFNVNNNSTNYQNIMNAGRSLYTNRGR